MEYDGKEEKPLTRDSLKCPEGWLWTGDWAVDKNRAVDEEGWEYSVEVSVIVQWCLHDGCWCACGLTPQTCNITQCV